MIHSMLRKIRVISHETKEPEIHSRSIDATRSVSRKFDPFYVAVASMFRQVISEFFIELRVPSVGGGRCRRASSDSWVIMEH
jgi:hypothetical protein